MFFIYYKVFICFKFVSKIVMTKYDPHKFLWIFATIFYLRLVHPVMSSFFICHCHHSGNTAVCCHDTHFSVSIAVTVGYTQVEFSSRYWLHCHSNSRVSRIKIENLKQQIGGDIIPLIFRKYVTPQIQKLKILRDNKNCQARYWLQVSFSS